MSLGLVLALAISFFPSLFFLHLRAPVGGRLLDDGAPLILLDEVADGGGGRLLVDGVD